MSEELTRLTSDMPIIYDGNRVTYVSDELAQAFVPGDQLIVVHATGDLLHVPAPEWKIAWEAVSRAADAFRAMGNITDQAISAFYEAFASRLADDNAFAAIAEANAADIRSAIQRGRSTTRLAVSRKMRADMVAGLRSWRDAPSGRGEIVETVQHRGWRVEQVRAGLGVVGFVFEGRPNVFADATGVLRSGNTVVFRIGSDALGTARAVLTHALEPALAEAGLPNGAVSLVDSPARAAGWALFSDRRLALAVARGSGAAVAQLGAVARQAGTPVSLHGTGGAWIVASRHADRDVFAAAVEHSLDRKVCNTLNTCCIVGSRAQDLVPVLLDALSRAAQRRGSNPKLHVTEGDQSSHIPPEWFRDLVIARAEGDRIEPATETIAREQVGEEWEWENSPEATLTVVDSVDEAVDLFNRHSPRFIASLVSEDADEHVRFFATIDAPFTGNGFTRWVDGQYALDRPELGLSNWQFGRLFGRGGILSGDSVFTIRTRVIQTDPQIRR